MEWVELLAVRGVQARRRANPSGERAKARVEKELVTVSGNDMRNSLLVISIVNSSFRLFTPVSSSPPGSLAR
jgi:hypothetical protein